MRKILILFLSAFVLASCNHSRTNLVRNGDFGNADGWCVGANTLIANGVAKASLSIPKYHTQWCEFLTQTVVVESGKDYTLTCCAKSSLPALMSSVYVGVRNMDGSVLKDMEYLLFHDSMTPLSVEFNSGENESLIVFCGSWANQSVELTFDDFCLKPRRF